MYVASSELTIERSTKEECTDVRRAVRRNAVMSKGAFSHCLQQERVVDL